MLERVKCNGIYWKMRQAVLEGIQRKGDQPKRGNPTEIHTVLDAIREQKEEYATLMQAIHWYAGKHPTQEQQREPSAIMAIQLRWDAVLKDNLERQEDSLFTWKTLFSLLETLKEDRFIDIKVDRHECINRVRQLLESDQTGFPEDSTENERRSMDRCKKLVDSTGEEWKVAADIAHVCRKGVPNCYRSELYSTYFRITTTNNDELFRERLAKPVSDSTDVELEDWVQDSIEKVLEDEAYFLFKEGLICTVETFVFDDTVAKCSTVPPTTLKIARGRTLWNIPFKSLGCLIAPFFYCSTDNQTVYWLFREMYTRHFIKLSALSSDEHSIIYLCALFEELLRRHLKDVHLHLLELGTSGLRIAFKWIFHSFVGFINVQQVFQLFDRMIGFGNNQILVFLALGVFTLKEEEILECDNLEQLEQSLADLRELNFVETLRLFLAKAAVPN